MDLGICFLIKRDLVILINNSLMFLLTSDLDTDGHLIFRLREKTHGFRKHSRAISKV